MNCLLYKGGGEYSHIPDSEVASTNCLFCLTNAPKPKAVVFAFTQGRKTANSIAKLCKKKAYKYTALVTISGSIIYVETLAHCNK